MLMRKKPIRGEKYILLPQDIQVTFIEQINYDTAKVILPNGQLSPVSMANLDLSTIDTSAYEKLKNAEA